MVRRLAWIFAIAGAAIFAALTAMLFSERTQVRIPAIAGLVTLVAVVISFLGGIEAGLALREREEPGATQKTRALAFVLGTVPALAAWGLLWLPSPHWQLSAALTLFVGIWATDLWLARQGLVPTWFVDMRTAVTAVAGAILGIALYAI
jgi:hypothetical protein